jgi:hypothetical protein
MLARASFKSNRNLAQGRWALARMYRTTRSRYFSAQKSAGCPEHLLGNIVTRCYYPTYPQVFFLERELRTTHPPGMGGWGWCSVRWFVCFDRWFMCLFVGVCAFSVGGFRLGKTPKAAQCHVFQVKLRALGALSYLQRH